MLAALLGTVLSTLNAAPDTAVHFTPEQRELIRETGAAVDSRGCVRLNGITLDPKTREITFNGWIQATDGILEVLIATPKGRIHESPVCANINAFELQLIAYLAGAENGTRKKGKNEVQGSLFRIEVKPENGGWRPLEEWIVRADKETPETVREWVFVGSGFNGTQSLAERDGNLVLLWSNGQTVFDNPQADGDTDNNFYPFREYYPPEALRGEKTPVSIRLIPSDAARP